MCNVTSIFCKLYFHWDAAMAQWICLCLPFYHPRFESQAHHLRFYHLQYLFYICHAKRTKINLKRPGLANFVTLFPSFFLLRIDNTILPADYRCRRDKTYLLTDVVLLSPSSSSSASSQERQKHWKQRERRHRNLDTQLSVLSCFNESFFCCYWCLFFFSGHNDIQGSRDRYSKTFLPQIVESDYLGKVF